MAQLKFKGEPANTTGDLPKPQTKAAFAGLVKSNLSQASLSDYAGKRKVLNVFPSIDTGVCATSVREFNKRATGLQNTVVLNISMDLPFALNRFCGAEGINNCESLSAFRSDFGKTWGLTLKDTPLAGLLARSVFVLDENDQVVYTELVEDIVKEPNYDAALKALK